MTVRPSAAATADTPRARVAVAAGTPELSAQTAALAARTGLPLSDLHEPAPGVDVLLVRTATGLELRDLRRPRVGAVYIDFHALLPRPGQPVLTRREPLGRAIGRQARTVIDATAGLAQDAFRLSAAGLRVVAIERHPAVAALLEDALARANDDTRLAALLGGRLSVRCGDARELLAELEPPDIVYLDPMFPAKRRASAAVRKDLQMLRDLVGEDPDIGELLAIARGRARERVIVKRPDHAPPAAPNPTVSYGGKLVRYDVYYTRPEQRA